MEFGKEFKKELFTIMDRIARADAKRCGVECSNTVFEIAQIPEASCTYFGISYMEDEGRFEVVMNDNFTMSVKGCAVSPTDMKELASFFARHW